MLGLEFETRKLDEERIGTMPVPPPFLDGWDDRRRVRYFREPQKHLHLIEIYSPQTTHFNVYEMEGDYSRWFVKYHVDLDAIPSVFPKFPSMIGSSLDPSDLHHYQFVLFSVVRREDDEESVLVLHVPGKVIPYNFCDKNLKKLFDVPPCFDTVSMIQRVR